MTGSHDESVKGKTLIPGQTNQMLVKSSEELNVEGNFIEQVDLKSKQDQAVVDTKNILNSDSAADNSNEEATNPNLEAEPASMSISPKRKTDIENTPLKEVDPEAEETSQDD